MARSSQRNSKPIPDNADTRKNEARTIPVANSINPKGASRLEYPVDVVSPGNHRRGMLQYASERGSRFRDPVLIIDGKEYGASELPKGCKVVVNCREVRAGPVWDLIRSAMTAGQFPLEILETERDEDMFRLMTEITALKSKVAQKDSQILFLEQRLREAQLLIHKKPWWAFWRHE